MKRAILDRLTAARDSGTPAALATALDGGAQSLIFEGEAVGDLALSLETLTEARRMLAEDRSGVIETAAGPVFIRAYNPPWRMIVVGAVHIAQSLVPIAVAAGYAVTVIDPRRAFATGERFPGVRMTAEWPDEALAQSPPDRRTALVTLTHDPKLDDPALAAALRSPAFYIGALGSTRTHAKRLDRLTAQGFSEGDLARIHGPAGLPIQAVTASEIAVSIIAQIVQARRKRS